MSKLITLDNLNKNNDYINNNINARLIDNASKNLLKVIKRSSTVNGITFTVNDNKSVTIVGTATAIAYFNLDFIVGLDTAVSICPTGNLTATFGDSVFGIKMGLSFFKTDGSMVDTLRIAGTTIFSYPTNAYKMRTYIGVEQGATVNATIYPMICRAEIIDLTYEPYYRTNKQLDSDLNSLTDKMSYNLLNISHDAGDYFILSGINYSVNKDDKYGTAVTSIVLKSGTANADANIVLNTDTFLENGKQYYLSGCPAGSDGNYSLSYGNYYDSGNGVIFTASQNTSIKINVKSGLTVNNLTFYPMITELLYKNKPFKPYITNLNDYIKVYDNSLMNISMPLGISINGQSESINSTTTYYSDPDTGEFETKQAGLNISSTNINLSYDYQKFRDLDFKSQSNSLSITEEDITLSVSSQNTGNKNAMIKIDATTGNIYIQTSNTNTITLKEYIQGVVNGTY